MSEPPNGNRVTQASVLGQAPSKPSRYVEIDFMRGIAVVLMIGYHLLYDIKTFVKFSFGLPDWFWPIGTHFIGFLFFTLFGISAWLAYDSNSTLYAARLRRRGLKLLFLSFGITAVTALASPAHAIYFGVLHCLAACTLLTYPFLKMRKFNLLLGFSIVVGALILQQFRFASSTFMWLGLRPEAGAGGDWFPLIPWVGVALIGIRVGEFLYPHSNHRSFFRDAEKGKVARIPIFLGRHSLTIYVLHQPLILATIYLVTRL